MGNSEKSKKLTRLKEIDKERWQLERVGALLQWDQETYLPEKGVIDRAEQLALIEGIIHQRLASEETGQLLADLGSTTEQSRGDEALAPVDRDFLRVLRRAYDRAVKLPGDFVSDGARAAGLSQAAWVQARAENNFAAFLPHLETMLDFAKRRALYWGYAEKPYDGLLDIYESGMGEDAIAAVFGPLRERLSSLLSKIVCRPRPNHSFLDRDFDAAGQGRFSALLLQRLGFDGSRGRLDESVHPFTTTLGSSDVRITTRYLPRQLLSSIFSTIHELGHAFYEMGFPEELRGTCLGDGASMGIHESQSRLWENVIGRSPAFWQALYPALREEFPDAFSRISAEEFCRSANLVEPSLIRVEADEVTYSLHVILRFELEAALFSGSLKPKDLPEAWRSKMKTFLGIEPETDSLGVLQDVHWSMGAFGYFPSYALGNLYGLHFWEKLNQDLGTVESLIAAGNFTPIHAWLRDNIHVWGARHEVRDLLKAVTGKELSAEPFLNYIENKYTLLYDL